MPNTFDQFDEEIKNTFDQFDDPEVIAPEVISQEEPKPFPVAKAYEPTIFDNIKDYFTGGEAHKARASNELVARKIAERDKRAEIRGSVIPLGGDCREARIGGS